MTTIRETFLPDKNCVMIRCDLSQIEDRMCKMYCGTPRMIELANRKPWEYDAHTETAVPIFKKPTEQITKDERYLAKKVRHGSQRGLRGERMSSEISKETKSELFIHPKQCDRMIDHYLDIEWEVRDIYFPWVRKQIRDVGILYDTWGGRLDLRKRRIDDDLYRMGYSFYMQVECARWTNEYLFKPMHYAMIERYGRPCNAQVHDEVIVSAPIEDAYLVAMTMVTAAEQTREIPSGSGNWLCVPAEVIVGRSYGDKEAVEFKRLPRKDDFFQALVKGGFDVK